MRSSDSQRRAWAHRAEGEREGRGNRLLLALTLLDLAPERRSEALDLLKQVDGLVTAATT